jgi:hypothetical protein
MGQPVRAILLVSVFADHFVVGFIFVYTFTMLVLYSEYLPGFEDPADAE